MLADNGEKTDIFNPDGVEYFSLRGKTFPEYLIGLLGLEGVDKKEAMAILSEKMPDNLSRTLRLEIIRKVERCLNSKKS